MPKQTPVMDWKMVLRANYRQMFFVFAAFFLMVSVSYFSISTIVRRQIIRSVDGAILAAEADVNAGLVRAETIMAQAAYNIRKMLDDGAPQPEILAYLTGMTGQMKREDTWTLGLNGIYGYIRGEFIDGIGLNPPPSYSPQSRPWFNAAVRNPGKTTVYSEPYIHFRSGDLILTAVRNIYGKDGAHYGILAINIGLSWLRRYVRSFEVIDGSYGIVLDQYMLVIGHPRDEAINRPLRNICEGYRKAHDALSAAQEISAMRVPDIDGSDVILSFRKMFNGWYIGVAVPGGKYYADLYKTAAILSSLGFVLMFFLCAILLRLSMARMRSDEENRAKSTFLARMSHEIRTPMNAVVGLSELGLRGDNLSLALEYFTGIHQAGQNLISIINDILDFSKIGSGYLEILPSPYTLAYLLNDVVNVTRVRLSKKNIFFAVNAESSLPNNLTGDETRVRQVLVNLLSNAAKYTSAGFVTFNVSGERGGDGTVRLKFRISDSGIGIKPEDMALLFQDFARFDATRNREIEGTGLGLAITWTLCAAMGGELAAESLYNEGSTFTATIPQEFRDGTPLASVENAADKKVLLYHPNPLGAKSLLETLNDLHVEAFSAANAGEFFAELRDGSYTFAFVSSELAARARDLIRGRNLKTRLTLLAELKEIALFQDIPALIMPAYAVSIANELNYRASSNGSGESGTSFTAPDARVLVVDDISTNLTVARGLMAPYRMNVDVCETGEESVRLFQEHDYDLILMDHMMPGMDGIEATALIRAAEKGAGVPVVALTANAVSGMREMFLQRGMNDFLSKPINTNRLDAVLRRWIPREKQLAAKRDAPVRDASFKIFEIEGADTKKGMLLSGGTEVGYKSVLRQYCRDVGNRLEHIYPAQADADLKTYLTHIHAIRSASATVGAAELSEEAWALEDACRRGDMAYIREQAVVFRTNLRAFALRVRAALDKMADEEHKGGRGGNGGEAPGVFDASANASSFLSSPSSSLSPSDLSSPGSLSLPSDLPSEKIPQLLSKLREALESENVGAADRLLASLAEAPLEAPLKNILSEISDMVLTSDFARAAGLLAPAETAKGLVNVRA